MGVSQRVRQHRFGGVEGKFCAELRVRGWLLLSVLFLAACLAAPSEAGEAGPALLEVLGLEIGNDELAARKLRRRKALLRRQIRAIKLDTMALGEQKSQAMAARVGPAQALAKALADLRFLESSLAQAAQRGKVVAEQLRQIDADEKRWLALKERGAELPKLIKSLTEAQLELEKQVAELSKKKATREAELARLKGNAVKTVPSAKKPAATQPAATKPAAKKPAAKKPAAGKAARKD